MPVWAKAPSAKPRTKTIRMTTLKAISAPSPRRIPGIIVEEEDDLPYLFFGKLFFPRRHRGYRRPAFPREARPSLQYPPEHIRLLELGYRISACERPRVRVEGVGIMAAGVTLGS